MPAKLEEIRNLLRAGKYRRAVQALQGLDADSEAIETLRKRCLCFDDQMYGIKNRNKLKNNLDKAYWIYRHGDSEAALQILDGNSFQGSEANVADILRTQVLYRLERFEECEQGLESILQKNKASDELLGNYVASTFFTNGSIDIDRFKAKFESNFELFFNCMLISPVAERFPQLLEKARELDEEYGEVENTTLAEMVAGDFQRGKDRSDWIGLICKVNLKIFDKFVETQYSDFLAGCPSVIGKLNGKIRMQTLQNLVLGLGKEDKLAKVVPELSFFCMCVKAKKKRAAVELYEKSGDVRFLLIAAKQSLIEGKMQDVLDLCKKAELSGEYKELVEKLAQEAKKKDDHLQISSIEIRNDEFKSALNIEDLLKEEVVYLKKRPKRAELDEEKVKRKAERKRAKRKRRRLRLQRQN